MNSLLTGVGTDIIEIERIAGAAKNPRFLERIFTRQEQEYCLARKNPYPCLAGRFAAKEAVLKALGTGLAGCRFVDVEILTAAQGGPPKVKLYGGARQAALKQGVSGVLLSISHDKERAVAFAVAVKE